MDGTWQAGQRPPFLFPRCGDHTVIQRILRHLGLPTETLAPRHARAPSILLDVPDVLPDHDVTAFDACS